MVKVNFYLILGTYIWRIGAIYEGEFLMGLRHGRGIWKSQRTNGDLYEG